MKYFIVIILLFYALVFSTQIVAQDIVGEKLGPGFVYSQGRSASYGQLIRQVKMVMFAQTEDLIVDVGVYAFSGSFEEAVGRIPIPQDADVSEITQQYAGAGLGFFLAMFENVSGMELDGRWLDQARSTVKLWEDARYRSYRVSQGEGALKADDNLSPGDKIEIFSLESQDPFIDFGDLQIVQGTWVIATRTRFTIPRGASAANDSDFDWNDKETDVASEPGITLFPGAKPVDPEATSYSGFFSDQSYLVEGPVEKVKRFYLELDGKFCSIDDESPMAFEEGEFMMTSILCLNHAGETKAGDNVIVITLFKAPPPILSDLIGRNQGDWTVISFDSWME